MPITQHSSILIQPNLNPHPTRRVNMGIMSWLHAQTYDTLLCMGWTEQEIDHRVRSGHRLEDILKEEMENCVPFVIENNGEDIPF